MNPLEYEPALPGADLVAAGLDDLAQQRVTDCSLLVLIAGPRLKWLGVPVPAPGPEFTRPYEHQLYDRLAQRLGDGAHSHYNSLIRRSVSFARALEQSRSRQES